MKTTMVIVALLVAFTPTTVTVSAQESSADFFSGVVLGVDVSKRLLSVEEASLEADQMTFAVPADADIRKSGARITLGDVAVGDPVSVEYESTAQGAVARSVKVITMPATD